LVYTPIQSIAKKGFLPYERNDTKLALRGLDGKGCGKREAKSTTIMERRAGVCAVRDCDKEIDVSDSCTVWDCDARD
jgi:hypothetical protein